MPTILLVEDNAIFRELIRETIFDQFPDMTILEAASASTALAAVKEGNPDLVFMDLNLAGESGLDLTKTIKQLYPAMKIIILTAYDMPEFKEAGLAAGASQVMVKSVLVENMLLTVVNRFIDKKPDTAL